MVQEVKELQGLLVHNRSNSRRRCSYCQPQPRYHNVVDLAECYRDQELNGSHYTIFKHVYAAK